VVTTSLCRRCVRTVTENDATWGEVARNDEELKERERGGGEERERREKDRDSHVASYESKRPFKPVPPEHVLNELGC